MDKSSYPISLHVFIYKMEAIAIFLPGLLGALNETTYVKMVYKLLRDYETQE